jgi:hypothetical protein
MSTREKFRCPFFGGKFYFKILKHLFFSNTALQYIKTKFLTPWRGFEPDISCSLGGCHDHYATPPRQGKRNKSVKNSLENNHSTSEVSERSERT